MKINDVRFVKGVVSWKDLPDTGLPEAAFIGRSNVGKSSLLNMLAGRKSLARISNTPGKTQEFNFYLVNDSLYFVDVPGYGYARISRAQRDRWARFIGRYLAQRETLSVVFHLVDSRHPPTDLDREIMMLIRESPAAYVVLLTKTDKLSGNERGKSLQRLREATGEAGLEVPIILTSATAKRGRDEILDWLGTIT